MQFFFGYLTGVIVTWITLTVIEMWIVAQTSPSDETNGPT